MKYIRKAQKDDSSRQPNIFSFTERRRCRQLISENEITRHPLIWRQSLYAVRVANNSLSTY
jgi:hypothetical protein